MAPKGLRGVLVSPRRHELNSRSALPTPKRIFLDSQMSQALEHADPIITKWKVGTSSFSKADSLFSGDRVEANRFVDCINDLQKSMHSMLSESSTSPLLVRAQFLMEIAMKRLQKEFRDILKANRAFVWDFESVKSRSSISPRSSSPSSIWSGASDSGEDSEDESTHAANKVITAEVEDASTLAMNDLKLIAECMIASGYGKECISDYMTIRKSIVDESVHELGVQKEKSSKIHKMDWEVVHAKIKTWLNAIKVAVTTLFQGERILCDHVFATSNSIRDSCFNEVTKEGATIMFGFPDIVLKNHKKSDDKILRVLDMHTALSRHWQQIESIFSCETTSAIVILALNSTIKLRDLVRTMSVEFATSIQKEPFKTPVAGAGVHHLTTSIMDFLSVVVDYDVLESIFQDSPPLPGSILDAAEASQFTRMSERFAWLILILVCKFDGNSKYYKDVSLSYLFLANNLQYVVSKVRRSNLKFLLGDDWISKHEAKVRKFAAKYEQLAWGRVVEAIVPTTDYQTALTWPVAAESVEESFRRFNAAFEEAQEKQSECVIPDSRLRDEIKVSIARKILPLYEEFYNAHATEMKKERNFTDVVRFTPEDLAIALSDLFFGSDDYSGSFSSSSHGGRETRD